MKRIKGVKLVQLIWKRTVGYFDFSLLEFDYNGSERSLIGFSFCKECQSISILFLVMRFEKPKYKGHKLRRWLIGKLLTDSEKYLLCFAIDDRMDKLNELKVTDKTTSPDSIDKDMFELKRFRYFVFKNNHFK